MKRVISLFLLSVALSVVASLVATAIVRLAGPRAPTLPIQSATEEVTP